MALQSDQKYLFLPHFLCGSEVKLSTPRSVLQYSSFVQESVSYLDLSTYDCSENRRLYLTSNAMLKHEFPRREILERMSLDVPCDIERYFYFSFYIAMNNKGRSPSVFVRSSFFESFEGPPYCPDSKSCIATKSAQFYLKGFLIENEVYTRDLEVYIMENIKKSSDQFKTMRRYIEILKMEYLRCLFWDYERIGDLYEFCLDLLVLNNVIESDILEFLMMSRASFDRFLCLHESVVKVRKVLQFAFFVGFEPWSPKADPINICLLGEKLKNLVPLIGYGNVPLFSKEVEEAFKTKIKSPRFKFILESVTDDDVKIFNRIPIDASVGSDIVNDRDPLTQQRLNILVYQLLVFLVCYKRTSYVYCRRILRLYWRSLEYPLLRRRDIDDAISQYFSTEVLDKVWMFYASNVDFDGFGFPRSLLHLSRYKCRKIIRENFKLPLPKVTCDRLYLPEEMFRYLNLQMLK